MTGTGWYRYSARPHPIASRETTRTRLKDRRRFPLPPKRACTGNHRNQKIEEIIRKSSNFFDLHHPFLFLACSLHDSPWKPPAVHVISTLIRPVISPGGNDSRECNSTPGRPHPPWRPPPKVPRKSWCFKALFLRGLRDWCFCGCYRWCLYRFL